MSGFALTRLARGGLFVALVVVIVFASARPARAQADFRRGDTNADGVVDLADLWMCLFAILVERPDCDAAFDVNADGSEDLSDPITLLNVLFLGIGEIPPPGMHEPGPDPNGRPCRSYEPDLSPRETSDEFTLRFDCPVVFNGEPGEPRTAVTHAVLESTWEGPGISAWSIGAALESDTVEITQATMGPVVEQLVRGGFEKTELASPSDSGNGAAATSAAVSAVIVSFTMPIILPTESPARILELELRAVADEPPSGRLFYADGLRGSGEPVLNVILIDWMCGSRHAIPLLESCEEFSVGTDFQLPGDCDQDGRLTISDPICLLGNLFLGEPERLPCGEGVSDEVGNVRLMDWHGDGAVDISDAVGTLRWLTLGGPEHVLGQTCVSMAACPLACF